MKSILRFGLSILLFVHAKSLSAQAVDSANEQDPAPPFIAPVESAEETVLSADVPQLPIEVITERALPSSAGSLNETTTAPGLPAQPAVDPLSDPQPPSDQAGADINDGDLSGPSLDLSGSANPFPPQSALDTLAGVGLHHRRLPANPNIVFLEAGMNYLNPAGRLVAAQELVEATADGPVSRRTQIKANFSSEINVSGAVDMTTADGLRFRATPLGLSYYDAASGHSVFIAQTKSAQAKIVPPNKVVYENFLDDVDADLLFEVKKAGIMQTVIIKSSLPPPSSFGLSDDTSRLEVVTEFVDPPLPAIQPITVKAQTDPAKRQAMVQPDLVDASLSFTNVVIPPGVAFSLNGPDNQNLARQPVAKTWQPLPAENRAILFEAVEYTPIKEQLNALPKLDRPRACLQIRERAKNLNKNSRRESNFRSGYG
jgi:hypothetical protein